MSNDQTFAFVRNYRPAKFQSAAALQSGMGATFSQFVGQTLDAVWLVWDHVADEWFCDAPVILEIAGKQLEVTAFKLDELYVSVNQIDRSLPIGWPDSDPEDFEIELVWRRNPPIIPKDVLGRTIKGFGATEYKFELADFVGTQPWVLVSLECELDGAHLGVHNGLDENALSFERSPDSDIHRVRWFEAGA